jgi:uncharacterized protein YcfJ
MEVSVMKKLLMTSVLSTGLILGTVQPTFAQYHTAQEQAQHHRHVKTAERVGIGAAGGGIVGGLAAGGPGLAIGALAGGGAGYLYDRHKRHHHYHSHER